MLGPLPLIGLRAFTETARCGSMKAAAEWLGVTPGAVSQQVKLLEARLGTRLFERRNRDISLTPAGQNLFKKLRSAFETIEAAVNGLNLPRHHQFQPRTLTVTTVTSFASTWLVPRLGQFMKQHPRIEFHLQTSSDLVDLRRKKDVTIALRHGLGDYPGLVATKILAPRFIPVCRPDLLVHGPEIRQPDDCLQFPLIQDADRADWSLWLRAHNARHDDARARRGPSMEHDHLAIQAALAGQGIALVRDIYVAHEIASGRLAIALESPWPTDFAYYFVTRPEDHDHPDVTSFRNWIIEQAQHKPG